MDLSGAPKTVLEVNDKSLLKDVPAAGIGVVQGPLNRGKIGEPIFVGNPLQFYRKCGGEISGNRFATYCLRILNTGAKLWIIRAGHYTTITDKTTLTGTKATATIAIAANNSIWTAEEVGAGYNGSTITIDNAASGDVALKDITILLKDSDVPVIIRDVPRVMNAQAITDFNLRLDGIGAGVRLTSIATQIENGEGVLAAGAQVIGDIESADYTGSVVAGNGWYVADRIVDAYRFANIGLLDEDVDEGLRAYCDARQDVTFYINTPLGVNADGMEDYRDGTSPYSHSPMDTWRGRLIGGDVNITDSVNKDQKFDIPGVVDVFAIRLRTDRQVNPFISHAGPKRGKVLSPNNGVPYNLISSALSADFDRIYPKGVNAIVKDPDYGVVYWGNKTLWKNTSSFLSRENVSDLVIYILRGLKPLVRAVQFDPNDPIMWKEMYRRVKPFINDLESSRAITPGENENWFWLGDQDVDRREDAQFNAQADLDVGKYRARFVFVPIAATEYIGIDIIPTDSNSVKFVVADAVVV